MLSAVRLQIKQIGTQLSRYQSCKTVPPVRWRSYRAAILEEFDKPLVVAKIKNETPLGMSMIRMSVDYCSLNIADVNKLSSATSSNADETLLPTIPGCEFSGEVIEVGDFVEENIKKGDKVVALLAHDHQIGGGLAQEAVVPEVDCFNCGTVKTKDAAVLVKAHGTAFLAFTKHCELKENDIVIVLAGAAGNGLAAIQIAKNVFKAKVYVICDTDDTGTLIRAEGAHKSISVKEGLAKVYKFFDEALKGRKAKVVYDAVGDGLLYVAADFVDRENGKFLSVDAGYDAAKFPSTKPKEQFKKSKKGKEPTEDENGDWFVSKIEHIDLHKLQETDKESYRQTVMDTLALSEEDLIIPYVSRTFGLSDVNEAVKFIKEKKCTGKVLIDVKEEKSGQDVKN